MSSTTYHLYQVSKICLALWDEAAEHLAPAPYAGLHPTPPPEPRPPATTNQALMAPIDKMLKAKDLKPGQLTGLNPGDAHNDRGFLHKRSCPEGCQEHHGAELHWGHGRYEGYTTWYRPGPRQTGRGAGNKMPQNLRHDLRRALLNLNMCDDAVFLLLPNVRKLFELIGPSAEVIHFAVIPRRRMQIFVHEKPGPLAYVHSVILIQSLKAGNFILDPAAEQYGHPPEHRFLPWRTYKRLYVLTKNKWIGSETWYTGPKIEHDLSHDPHGEQYLRHVQNVILRCIESWLRRMEKGGLSLRQDLGDEVCGQQMREELCAEMRHRL
ncbi:hypothetical protein E8E13_006998 [Curvularia kusanoi]|uniref:Uncharacterized protein n=1 Tax=Curvularia kusanoi TaxID=90978 RepID=A0A9P4W5A2_CURKU|nr:hypothetical protein E8E13_006998 [Curvularia kusanoi]